MSFTTSLSANQRLLKAMEDYARELMFSELLPDEEGRLRELFISENNVSSLLDDLNEDMVMDSFYKMLDTMREVINEYRPYIVEELENENE